MPKHSFSLAACVLLLLSLAACNPVPAPRLVNSKDQAAEDRAAEDQAAKIIVESGGEVVRDDKDPSRPVVKVDLDGALVTYYDLKELAAFKGLKELALRNTLVTAADLWELARFKSLTNLDLSFNPVMDTDLRACANSHFCV